MSFPFPSIYDEEILTDTTLPAIEAKQIFIPLGINLFVYVLVYYAFHPFLRISFKNIAIKIFGEKTTLPDIVLEKGSMTRFVYIQTIYFWPCYGLCKIIMFITQLYFKYLVKSELVLTEENLLKSIGFVFLGLILVFDNIQLGERSLNEISSKLETLTLLSTALGSFMTVLNFSGSLVFLPNLSKTK